MLKGKDKTSVKLVRSKAKAKGKAKAKPKAKAKAKALVAAMPSAETVVRQSFLMPHEVFHHLYTHKRATFDKYLVDGLFGAGVCNARGFWKGVSATRDPHIQHHPMLSVDQWHDLFLPIAIHADAISCLRSGRQGSKSCDVISWHGLLGKGSTMEVKHLITSVFKPCVSENTKVDVWRAIVWSLRAQDEGR